jgi:protein SCO1/2
MMVRSRILGQAARPASVVSYAAAQRAYCLIAGMLLLLAGCTPSAVPAADQSPPLLPGLPTTVNIQAKLGGQVPLELSFRDESGQVIRVGQCVNGKPTVLALVYYECPMLCNMVLDGLVRSLRALELDAGETFSVLVVSIDPRETPALAAAARHTALRRYARQGSEEGWHFLTGSEPSIRRLADAVGFRYTLDEKTGQYAHGAGLFLLTGAGVVSRYFSGVEYSARDLQFGLIESSAGKIGSTTHQVLLLCFQYDPSRGKYGLAIIRVVRAAGVATVCAMLFGFYWLTRRQQRADKTVPLDPLDGGRG